MAGDRREDVPNFRRGGEHQKPLEVTPISMVQGELTNQVTDEEGEIRADDKELIRVYDPMTLINFSEHDLLILHDKTLMYQDAWGRQLARQFEKIVRVCVKHGIHTGSLLPNKWK
ncbi:hypothetical protein L1987_18599 [Smallanthus sonchifolius]|uniref:Uncharacterized protein n=1 Tax=Smallanthus sonchifolius TaxID=185202 RepID=A0ACB9J021_9ASTR|nr:hypothetical protein L1987_18599 [Smallanthus sonchifolius]